MSPKKAILKTLTDHHQKSGPGVLTRPATIPGFQSKPERFQQAVNSLLQERLIEGTRDPEGRMAISLNACRLADVRKELRPFWFHPAFVALMGLLAVAASVGLMG
jgi:hypothetical protein